MSLRSRFLLALIAISVLTLVAVALALLPPLQNRIRQQSQENLARIVLGTRAGLIAALARARQSGDIEGETARRANALALRAGARVLIYSYPVNVTEPPAFDSGAGSLGAIDDVFRAQRLGSTIESTARGVNRMAMPLPARGPSAPPDWVLAVRQPQVQATEAAAVVQRGFIAATIGSLVVAVLIGIVISGTLVRRLQSVRRSALALADGGVAVTAPPDDSGRDEVGDLARALRSMQLALQRQEEARRAFVATASHELRTPITSLQGNLELLGEDLDSGDLDLAEARRQVSGAQLQLRRLANLATELLDLSRLDAGVELRQEPLDITEVARAVSAEFAQTAIDRRTLIEVTETRAPVWATGDPGAVAQILRILIDNALRFTPPGGLILVTADYRGEQAIVDVIDDGPGVIAAEREQIFERFRRGARTGGEGGFGLGLAIGRELAIRMDGKLYLIPSDTGASFRCTLPIAILG